MNKRACIIGILLGGGVIAFTGDWGWGGAVIVFCIAAFIGQQRINRAANTLVPEETHGIS